MTATKPIEAQPPDVKLVYALLKSYLPLGDDKAKAFALKLLKQRAVPVPGKTPGSVRSGSELYHPKEIEAACDRMADAIGPGDFVTYPELRQACRLSREATIASVHARQQDLQRKALPALTGDAPEMRDHVSADPDETRRRVADIVSGLVKRKVVR